MARKISCMVCKSIGPMRSPLYVKDGGSVFLFIICERCFEIINRGE